MRRLGLVVAVSVCLCLLPRGVSAVGDGVTLRAGSMYVSMGSSYASGALIQPQESGADSCSRSLINYPHLVAKSLHLHLTDVSCSGAVTANALNTSQGSAPPQVQAVTSHTRLVTFTIGGNDVNYVGTANACGADPNCASKVDQGQLDAAFQKLPRSLTRLIKAVRAKAPSAVIVLVTYPRLVPASACPALHFSSSGRRLVASIGARLEQVFRTVAKSTHIHIADPYRVAAGHGPCAPAASRWIAGTNPTNGAEYHPTAAGHREMARLVEQTLGSN